MTLSAHRSSAPSSTAPVENAASDASPSVRRIRGRGALRYDPAAWRSDEGASNERASGANSTVRSPQPQDADVDDDKDSRDAEVDEKADHDSSGSDVEAALNELKIEPVDTEKPSDEHEHNGVAAEPLRSSGASGRSQQPGGARRTPVSDKVLYVRTMASGASGEDELGLRNALPAADIFAVKRGSFIAVFRTAAQCRRAMEEYRHSDHFRLEPLSLTSTQAVDKYREVTSGVSTHVNGGVQPGERRETTDRVARRMIFHALGVSERSTRQATGAPGSTKTPPLAAQRGAAASRFPANATTAASTASRQTSTAAPATGRTYSDGADFGAGRNALRGAARPPPPSQPAPPLPSDLEAFPPLGVSRPPR